MSETQPPGARLIAASWLGTVVLLLTSALGLTVSATRPAVVVTDVVLFGIGCAAMLGSLVTAADRSRNELLTVPGVWFLSESTPTSVRRHLLASLAAQVVVSIVAASVRPNRSVAFGILVPMLGLGLAGLWGARYGAFPQRPSRTALDDPGARGAE